jgi:hypothetical protein
MHQTAKQFLSRRYLWDQIFSDSRGFHDNHEIYLALQSGFLRRLKCSSRAVRHARFQRPVYNTETTDIRSGFILPIDTALGETEGFNAPSFGLFDYDFGPVAPLSLAIVKIATRMRDQKYQRWCHEILDELDSVGCQLAREATGDEFDEFDDAEWVSLFMDYGREDGISCSRTFLDVVIFFDLSTYLAAKIVEHGLGQDQLTSLLARAIHMHSFFWRNTGLVHTVDVTQHSETIHVLLKKGADPNGREAVSRLGRNEIDSVRTSWTGLLVKIRMQENLMSTDRIHSARICPLVKRFLDCGADPIAQWYWTSRDGNKEFLTPRIVVELISEFIVGPEWKEILGILASAEEKAKRAVATASV